MLASTTRHRLLKFEQLAATPFEPPGHLGSYGMCMPHSVVLQTLQAAYVARGFRWKTIAIGTDGTGYRMAAVAVIRGPLPVLGNGLAYIVGVTTDYRMRRRTRLYTGATTTRGHGVIRRYSHPPATNGPGERFEGTHEEYMAEAADAHLELCHTIPEEVELLRNTEISRPAVRRFLFHCGEKRMLPWVRVGWAWSGYAHDGPGTCWGLLQICNRYARKAPIVEQLDRMYDISGSLLATAQAKKTLAQEL